MNTLFLSPSAHSPLWCSPRYHLKYLLLLGFLKAPFGSKLHSCQSAILHDTVPDSPVQSVLPRSSGNFPYVLFCFSLSLSFPCAGSPGPLFPCFPAGVHLSLCPATTVQEAGWVLTQGCHSSSGQCLHLYVPCSGCLHRERTRCPGMGMKQCCRACTPCSHHGKGTSKSPPSHMLRRGILATLQAAFAGKGPMSFWGCGSVTYFTCAWKWWLLMWAKASF